MKKSNSKRGFTIVEMVIVIAIVAILAAVLIPTYSNIVKKAKNSAYEQEKTNQQLIDATEEIERLQAENKSLETIKDEYGSWDNIEAIIKSALSGLDTTTAAKTEYITIKTTDGSNAANAEQISAAVKTAVEKAMEKISTGGSGLTAEQLEMIVKNVVENSTNVTDGGVTYVNNSYYTTETKNVIEVGSLIGELNNIIIMKGASKVIIPSDAEKMLAENGFDVSKLQIKANPDYRIAFDSKLHRFCMVKNDGSMHTTESNATDIFVYLYDNEAVDSFSNYSVYLTENYQVTNGTITVGKGIDTGKAEVTTVNYKNTSGAAQNVIIRTNTFNTILNIDGYVDSTDATKGDTVAHYGFAAIVDVKKVASASYDEFGTVGRIEIKQGHIEAMDGAEIFCLMETGGTNKVTETTVNTGAVIHAVDNDDNKDDNGVAHECVADCGAGNHQYSGIIFDGEHFYDVCKSCGYTLVCVKDSENNTVKQTMNTVVNSEVVEKVSSVLTYEVAGNVNLSDANKNAGNFVVDMKTESTEYTPTPTGGDSECKHTNYKTTVIRKPTCTSEGMNELECTACHAKTYSLVHKTAHRYYDNVGFAHTADETCSVCGHVRGNKEIAKVGNTVYSSLTDAIAAAPTDGSEYKITMLADDAVFITEGTRGGNMGGWHITAGKNIVVDLAGYTLKNLITFPSNIDVTSTNANNGVFRVYKDGSLTIKDSSCVNTTYDGTGMVYNELADGVPETYWAYDVKVNRSDDVIISYGNFTLESGTLDLRSNGMIIYAIDSLYTGDVKIKGGSIINSSNNSNLIRCFGEGADVEISGGYFNSKRSAVFFQAGGNDHIVKIKGGLFDLGGDIVNYYSASATVEITGGTYITGAGPFVKVSYVCGPNDKSEEWHTKAEWQARYPNDIVEDYPGYEGKDEYYRIYTTDSTYSPIYKATIAEGYTRVDNGNGTVSVVPAN